MPHGNVRGRRVADVRAVPSGIREHARGRCPRGGVLALQPWDHADLEQHGVCGLPAGDRESGRGGNVHAVRARLLAGRGCGPGVHLVCRAKLVRGRRRLRRESRRRCVRRVPGRLLLHARRVQGVPVCCGELDGRACFCRHSARHHRPHCAAIHEFACAAGRACALPERRGTHAGGPHHAAVRPQVAIRLCRYFPSDHCRLLVRHRRGDIARVHDEAIILGEVGARSVNARHGGAFHRAAPRHPVAIAKAYQDEEGF
mmetsp:Transcript_4838/g.16868  ORF Transcript_4838/g.16868 Transcript_4838/m.16868 type:complete len:257 (-) Transcript_4838:2931-3701(-)